MALLRTYLESQEVERASTIFDGKEQNSKEGVIYNNYSIPISDQESNIIVSFSTSLGGSVMSLRSQERNVRESEFYSVLTLIICLQVRRLNLSLYISLFFILAIAIISIYIPPLLILHPPIPKAHADLPQSDALVDPPLSEAPVNVDHRNSEALLDPPKSNVQVDPSKSEALAESPRSRVHADPPMSEVPVNVGPPLSEAPVNVDPPKSEARLDTSKAKARVKPPKSKARVDPPKSKGLANSHQPDDQIVDWSSVRHLWLDEN
ncbi:hypothetical protein POTOM_009047 [Populus tomentosa]|uniref:Uncharacterized protein n=1 Tax=Populus tomentosa TaxID=118781 RepID=A0A8X8AD56_POPTO|nr:hypothetical protein POTOM_009047 [Populus tomentosa]